jgi:hypothetical protein
MPDEKIAKLLESVLSKTRAGRIPWEPTAQETNFIAAIGGQFTLSVSAWSEISSDFSAVPVVRKCTLALRDQIGRELAKVAEGDEGIRPDEMQELYETARRQAVRAGERIDDALAVLNSL